jgi:hypothetical protein
VQSCGVTVGAVETDKPGKPAFGKEECGKEEGEQLGWAHLGVL